MHPYRHPAAPPEPAAPAPPRREPPVDDAALAAILFVVGALGVAVGLHADRATELTIGLLLVALSAKVAREARQISI